MARKRKKNNAAANLKIMENVLQKEINRAERAMKEINDNDGIFSNETNEWLMEMGLQGQADAKLLYFGQAIRGLMPGCDWALMEQWANDIVKLDAGLGYFMLGSLYSPGVPGYWDEEKSIMYYQKGAKAGHEECINILKETNEDEEWIKSIPSESEIEDKENTNNSKELHYYFQELKDFKLARHYLKLWHKEEPDNTECMLQMATYYLLGSGVTKSYKQAFKFYSMAADAGSATGLFYVGLMYYQGHGCKRDGKAAMSYFEKAIQGKYYRAYYYMGLCYDFGVGVPRDSAQAFKYYKAGAEKNDPECHVAMSLAYTEGTHVKINYKTAEKHLKKAKELAPNNADFIHDRIVKAESMLIFSKVFRES